MWTDKAGRFTVKARFVRYEKGNVILKREDGKMMTVHSLKLSKTDIDYCRKEMRRRYRLSEKDMIDRIKGKKDK